MSESGKIQQKLDVPPTCMLAAEYQMCGTHYHVLSELAVTPLVCPLMLCLIFCHQLLDSNTNRQNCEHYVHHSVFKLTDKSINNNNVLVITKDMANAGVNNVIDVEDETGNTECINTTMSVRTITLEDTILTVGTKFGGIVGIAIGNKNASFQKDDGNLGMMQSYGLHTHNG